jgi:hypothetical protein
MSSSATLLFALGGLAIAAVAGWMVMLYARLRAIERAVASIAANTDSLREIVGLLRSVDGNTSLLGGLGRVFRSPAAKRP